MELCQRLTSEEGEEEEEVIGEIHKYKIQIEIQHTNTGDRGREGEADAPSLWCQPGPLQTGISIIDITYKPNSILVPMYQNTGTP